MIKLIDILIEKFNTPITLSSRLSSQLYELKVNEITLNPNNAVEINGDLFDGEFKVGDIEYVYSIDERDNLYGDDGEFYSIAFDEKKQKSGNIPTGNAKENYIKILSTMFKIILNFAEKIKPKYIGLSSLDKSGYGNIYNNLSKTNKIPGYSRKDAGLNFTTRSGDTGKFVVLKRIEDKTLNELGEATNFYPWKLDFEDDIAGDIYYSFESPENSYTVAFANLGANSYDITFGTDNPDLDTKEGVSLKVMATVTKITLDFIEKYDPRELVIHPIETSKKVGDDLRRFKLYGVFLKKNLPNNYSLFTLGSNYRVIKK